MLSGLINQIFFFCMLNIKLSARNWGGKDMDGLLMDWIFTLLIIGWLCKSVLKLYVGLTTL